MLEALWGLLHKILSFALKFTYFFAGAMVLNYIWQAVKGNSTAPSGSQGRSDGGQHATMGHEHDPLNAGEPAKPTTEEEEAILKEIYADYIARADASRETMGDKKLTVEHLVLAMARDPRFGRLLLWASNDLLIYDAALCDPVNRAQASTPQSCSDPVAAYWASCSRSCVLAQRWADRIS